MRIDLRRTDRAMPQHPLDIPNIHILLQQQSRKGMPKHVRSDMLADAGQLRIPVDHKPHGLIRQLMPQSVHKEIPAGSNILPEAFFVQH